MQTKPMKPIRIFAILIFFILVFSYSISEIYCLDIWLHLKTGEHILENRSIPKVDIYSFTQENKEWINHEWLSQVIFYSIYNKFGTNGLILFRAIIILSVFLLLFFICHRKELSSIVILLLLAVLFLSEQRFMIRPGLFTLLFTCSYLFILTKHRSSKLIYILPIIQLFWVNMHGYFFIGFLVILICIISETLKRNIKLPFAWNKNRTSLKEYNRLIITAFLIIVALFVTPYGLKGALYPFKVLSEFTKHHNMFLKSITETIPLFSQGKINLPHLAIHWFNLLFLVSALSFFANFKKIDIENIVLFSAALFSVLIANRHIAIFSVLAYITAISNFDNSYSSSRKIVKSKKIQEILQILFMLIFISFMSKHIIDNFKHDYYSFENNKFKKFTFGIGSFTYPKKATDFIEQNEIKGNVLNDANSGSYFIWRLYPEKKVFIDGRTEVYGSEFYKLYKKAFYNKEIFKKVISEYNINCVLITYIADLPVPINNIRFLNDHKKWVLVYIDDKACIFLKDVNSNKTIINKFEIGKRKPSFFFTDTEIEKLKERNVYPSPMIQTASILKELGYYKQAIEELKVALRIKPDAVIARKIIGHCYIAMGDYKEAKKYLDGGKTN